jgi:two-component system sensor histidine kinase RegB
LKKDDFSGRMAGMSFRWSLAFFAPESLDASGPLTASGVNNRTLMAVRWVAIAGQTLTVLVVHFGLGIHLPLGPAFGFILASAGLNLAMAGVRGATGGLSVRQAAACLAFDILQISGLLFLTGGVDNPFSILLVAPVTVGASLLPFRAAAGVAGVALACLGGLTLAHLPLGAVALPPLYRAGFEVSVLLTLVFTAAYVWRTTSESRRMAAALHESRLALSRQSKAAALGAQAAAAAHELGSPLSTIYVISSDLKKSLPPGHALSEDVEILVSQSRRCKDILCAFARRPETEEGGADPVGPFWPQALLSGIVEPLRMENTAIDVRVEATAARPGGVVPMVARTPELVHGLGNLIQNAIQFARARVTVRATWDEARFTISVEDDGPGFPPALLSRLGEPYVSTRRGGEGGNMGLGVFISRTLLEPTGATLLFSNRLEGGARIEVLWDRKAVEFRRETP